MDDDLLDSERSSKEETSEFELSDEEVLEIGSHSDEDRREDIEVIENDKWGTRKQIYYGNDDISDDEDVVAEEIEARRLQKAHLQNLHPEDFVANWDLGQAESDGFQLHNQPNLECTQLSLTSYDLANLSGPDKITILQTHFPYLIKYAQVYEHLYPLLKKLNEESLSNGFSKLKYGVVCTLLSLISVFFGIQPTANNSVKKRDVSRICQTLTKLENLWDCIQAFSIKHEIGSSINFYGEHNEIANVEAYKSSRSDHCENGIMAQLESSEDNNGTDDNVRTHPRYTYTSTSNLKNKFKMIKDIAKVFESSLNKSNDDYMEDLDYTEAKSISLNEAAAKAERKRTLQFHTSRINNTVARRSASLKHQSGDAEHFKESRKEREERLKISASKRLQNSLAKIDTIDKTENTDAKFDDESHYESLATLRNSKQEKKLKKIVDSSVRFVGDDTEQGNENLSLGSKRQISRLIEKNRGLTPKRSKESRNPRVKKRRKYEQKKKKLASRQAIHSSDRKDSYAGEKTGISKVAKSIKLA